MKDKRVPRLQLTGAAGGGAAEAWTPETPLSGVAPTLWVKSDAGLFTDVNKTVPAVNDGDLIYKWANQSTGDADMTQATEAKRPLLKIVNGKNYIRTDGIDDYLQSIMGASRTTLTYFVVCKKNSDPTALDRALISLTGTASNVLSKSTDVGVGFGYALNSIGGVSDMAGVCTNLSVVCLKYTDAAHCSSYVDDGSAVAIDPDDGYIGTNFVIGARSTGNAKWCDADYAEILIYPAALSDADRVTAKNYLKSRWTDPS